MLRITDDPSSRSLVECLVKNYKNGSIVSVDMSTSTDTVGERPQTNALDPAAIGIDIYAVSKLKYSICNISRLFIKRREIQTDCTSLTR